MLDITFIRDNLVAVEANIRNRNMQADPRLAVALHEERSRSVQALEAKRAARNENASRMKGKLEPTERQALIDEGKALKDEIGRLETTLSEVEPRPKVALMQIPNMAHPDAPVGKTDVDNPELKRIGVPTQFLFPALDHVQLGEKLDIIDFEAGTKVSGTKFYFLKN